MDLRRRLLHSTLSVAVLFLVAAFSAGTAAASTGGTTAPSAGGTPPGSAPQSAGNQSARPPRAPGTQTPTHRSGGIAPGSVRIPTAPVKIKKKKRRRPPRRPPTSQPTPAPPVTPAPVSDIPAGYLKTYRAAAKSVGVDWRILAAIGKNESDHGRSTLPGVKSGRNFANCCSGPMQICTVSACSNTWRAYAVDGDGDGIASVYDPQDAIYAAAALVRDLRGIVGNNPKLILAAYNAGPGNVARYGGVPPFPETQAYVRAGLAYIAKLR